MTPKEILFALSIILFFYYTVIYLEIFSRKEYRLDRLKAHIDDFGIFELVWPSDIRRPKISHPRNILILLLVFTVFLFFLRSNMWLALLFFSAAPITSFSTTALAVFISSIPVTIYRKLVIQAAQKRIARFNPFVVGVTGSYGKSITKTYIAHVLSKKFKVLETPKNTNTDIGIALFILKNLHLPNTLLVIEMGAYKKGEIRNMCMMTKPRIGVITAFGTQHASIFGGVKNIIEAKCELAMSLPKDGMLFLPLDEKKKIPTIIFSKIQSPVNTYKKIPQDAHLQSIQAAAAVAAGLGMTYDTIQDSIESLPKPENLKIKKHLNRGYEILLSPYSTNTDAFISHLSTLKKLKSPKKIIITPGIIELGTEKEIEYSKIVKKIPKDALVFTTDLYFARLCQKEKIYAIFQKSQGRLFQSVNKQRLNSDYAILVEGRFRKEFLDTIA